jgi:hypothetical protein
MKSNYLVLIGRIEQTLDDVERVVNRAEKLMKQALRSGDDGYWDGVALNLHSFYAGLEQIFEDIARTIERSIPSGSNWHKDLLLQISAEVPHVRPPVIQTKTRHCLDEYRSFRHVVRNVYTFNLKSKRLHELVEQLRPCYDTVMADLVQFIDFLKELGLSHADDT